jgi:2-oxoisovalerate dehydrogenase E1 component
MIAERAKRVLAGHADPSDRVGVPRGRRSERPPGPPAPARRAAAKSVSAAPARSDIEGEPITMPFGDLTVSEGKLVKWYRKAGDRVARGEHVADIETEKAVVDAHRALQSGGEGVRDRGRVEPCHGSIELVEAELVMACASSAPTPKAA